MTFWKDSELGYRNNQQPLKPWSIGTTHRLNTLISVRSFSQMEDKTLAYKGMEVFNVFTPGVIGYGILVIVQGVWFEGSEIGAEFFCFLAVDIFCVSSFPLPSSSTAF